jgi:hypothetical protein
LRDKGKRRALKRREESGERRENRLAGSFSLSYSWFILLFLSNNDFLSPDISLPILSPLFTLHFNFRDEAQMNPPPHSR